MGSSSKNTPEQQPLPSPNLANFPYFPKRLNRPNRPDRLDLPDLPEVRHLPDPSKPRNRAMPPSTSPPPRPQFKPPTRATATPDPPGKRGEAELRTSFKETEKKPASPPEERLDGMMENFVEKLKGKPGEVDGDDGKSSEREGAGWRQQEEEARRQRDGLMRKMISDKEV